MNGRRREDDPIGQYLLSCIQAELEKKWREKEDKKGISKDAHLKIELSKLPLQWIQATYHELGYVEKMSKHEQIWYITYILNNAKFLEKILVQLSRSSLFILKYLLSKGGWTTFQSLSRQANTDESSDSWWWTDKPPSSPVGQLRTRGLLFVGRAPVKNRLYKIAVIPRELREILDKILPRVYHLKDRIEQRSRQGKGFLPRDEGKYPELLRDVENYFHRYIDEPFWLKKRQIVTFLQHLRKKNVPFEEIDQAWEDIQCFFNFIQHFSFGKNRLEDFKTWDFSYFVSKFIPEKYEEPALTYEEVRRILHNVAKLYRNLKEKEEIESDKEIQKAVLRIIRKDGKIIRIPSPPAKGPETLLRIAISGSGEHIPFTNNDLWSVIVLCLEYNQSWRTMVSDLEGKGGGKKIVDAERKKDHLAQLHKKMREGRIRPYTILCHLKPDRREIDRAIRWFYKKKFVPG